MVIEARHLVDLGHRQVHLVCQGDKVTLVQCPAPVVEQMQKLDQPTGWPSFDEPIAEQRPALRPATPRQAGDPSACFCGGCARASRRH